LNVALNLSIYKIFLIPLKKENQTTKEEEEEEEESAQKLRRLLSNDYVVEQ
jgi:hypothetical protein